MDELEFAEPEDSELFEAVMKLPDKYRIVIHLFYYEEQSITEISETLKRREGTVKSQLSRGRALLKEMLTEEWNND
jgi:RNA polymerase sigma-70 factor (ECF subfamily)